MRVVLLGNNLPVFCLSRIAPTIRRAGAEGIVLEVFKNDGLHAVKVGDSVPLYGSRDAGRDGEIFLQLWDGQTVPHFFLEIRFGPDGKLVASGLTAADLRRIVETARHETR